MKRILIQPSLGCRCESYADAFRSPCGRHQGQRWQSVNISEPVVNIYIYICREKAFPPPHLSGPNFSNICIFHPIKGDEESIV